MIRTIAQILPFSLLAITSCTTSPETKQPLEKPVTSCYEYTENKDTISLSMTRTGDNVTGTLVFNLFEKDRNTGTIKGLYSKHTIHADYTFQSEGLSSVRPIELKLLFDDVVLVNEGNQTLHEVDCVTKKLICGHSK